MGEYYCNDCARWLSEDDTETVLEHDDMAKVCRYCGEEVSSHCEEER